jgi:hypothetical protein
VAQTTDRLSGVRGQTLHLRKPVPVRGVKLSCQQESRVKERLEGWHCRRSLSPTSGRRGRGRSLLFILLPGYQISEASAEWNQNRVVLDVDFGYCSYWKLERSHNREFSASFSPRRGCIT